MMALEEGASMKTGTSCTRCANAATCPKFDSHVLYGFCRGFEPDKVVEKGGNVLKLKKNIGEKNA